ncbi:MAG: transketolase [bacterium]
MKAKPIDLEKKAEELRKVVFKTICLSGGGHIAGSLSIIEILEVLYNGILRISPKEPMASERDRFILSKGHAGVSLYAILADCGFFPKEELDRFGKAGSILGGHPDMHKVPGIEASTGSLGHGFCFGTGIALAGKLDKKDFRVFVLLGDGECQEGSIWETAMFAPQHKLDNLVAIIDYNKIQALDRLDKIVSLEPLAAKWTAFGWEVKEVDGHNVTQLQEVLGCVPFVKGKPSLIIAHTIKGKGISFMENVAIWHYRMPNHEELKIACKDLNLEDLQDEP